MQISDLHLGDSSRLGRTERIIRAINAIAPDLIVSTGDLFDGYLKMMGPYVERLRELEAPLGKYAVSGNHEAYAGLGEALSLTGAAGFTVLRGRSVALDEGICIAGVDDPAIPQAVADSAVLAQARRDLFTILLKHRPDISPECRGKFDLQLSGHTHGGQIAPFHLLTRLAYRAKPGLSEIFPQQYLYLSRGSGSWGPQIRLFAPCEITVFTVSA